MKKFLKGVLFSFVALTMFFANSKIVNAAVKVVYNPQNGEATRNMTLQVGANINIVNSLFTKTGYELAGWYDHEDWVMGSKFDTAPDSYDNRTLNLYARWVLAEYNITYNLNGGTVNGTNPNTYHYMDNTKLIINPEKEGYEFIGWTGTDLTTPTTQLVLNYDFTGDREYTANWEPIEYTITYDLDGGNDPSNPTSYTIEDNNFDLIAPEKEGYEFIGWTGSNGDTPEKNVTVNTSDLENKNYKANYLKKVKLIIRYLDKNNNSLVEERVIDYLEKDIYEAPEAIVIEKYVLDSTRLPEKSGEFNTEDIYVDYYYKELFTVKFNSDGGTEVEDILNVVDGTEITLNSYKTTKEGYNFLGWYDEEGNKVENITVEKDRELTAKWEKIEEKQEGKTSIIESTPNTADNVLIYIISLLLSLITIVKVNILRKNS